MTSKKNWGGFTLVELMLALGIFSIVSLSLYVTFANGLNLEREAKKFEDVYRELRWVVRALEKDLESLAPYYPAEKDRQDLLAFTGTTDRCSLILLTGGMLQQVSYFLQDPGFDHVHKIIVGKVSAPQNFVVSSDQQRDVKYLVREERPLFFVQAEGEESQRAEVEIMSRFVKEETFSLSYAKIEGSGDAVSLAWKEQWQERYPPAGLRIQMQLGDTSGQIKRDILIPIGMWGERVY